MHECTKHDVKKSALVGCAAVTAVALAVALNASAAGAVTAAKRVDFGGSAYGSTASLGTLVNSGETAHVPLCTTKVGASHTDRTAGVHLPGVGDIGAVITKVSSAKSGRTVSSVTTTRTGATSLLGGLVQATAITTSARVSLTGKTYSRKGTSTLVGLTIAGRAVDGTPTVNQTIGIPGVGKIILNKQVTSSANAQHSLSVTALQVVLSAGNTTALPSGNVVIGHAVAALHAPTHANPYGTAYGTRVQLGSTVDSGATAPVYLPCGGSNGATRTNKTAAVNLSGVLSAGAVTSSAHSSDTAKATSATTASHIASVNLFGGVITVRGVTTEAHAVRRGTHLSLSSTGTKLVALTVNGNAQSVPAPNTARSIPGVGTLYFDRTTRSSTGIHVVALQIVLSQAQGSAAAGTVITIGSATAGVLK